MPLILKDILEFLRSDESIINSRLLFRFEASIDQIKNLESQFVSPNKHVDLEKYDSNLVSMFLIYWADNLPDSILPIDQFVLYQKALKRTHYISKISNIVESIPKSHLNILQYFVLFLKEVSSHSEFNSLTPNNIASIFGSLLFKIDQELDSEAKEEYINVGKSLIEIFINSYENIFLSKIEDKEDIYQQKPIKPPKPSLLRSLSERTTAKKFTISKTSEPLFLKNPSIKPAEIIKNISKQEIETENENESTLSKSNNSVEPESNLVKKQSFVENTQIESKAKNELGNELVQDQEAKTNSSETITESKIIQIKPEIKIEVKYEPEFNNDFNSKPLITNNLPSEEEYSENEYSETSKNDKTHLTQKKDDSKVQKSSSNSHKKGFFSSTLQKLGITRSTSKNDKENSKISTKKDKKLSNSKDSNSKDLNSKESKESNSSRLSNSSIQGSIFGLPLENIVFFKGETACIPNILKDCIFYLSQYDRTKEFGIFRESGSYLDKLSLMKAYDSPQVKIDLEGIDSFTVANLIKEWLRALPDPILPESLYQSFKAAVDSKNEEELSIQLLKNVLMKMSDYRRNILHYLINFLKEKVSPYSKLNGMTEIFPLYLVLLYIESILHLLMTSWTHHITKLCQYF